MATITKAADAIRPAVNILRPGNAAGVADAEPAHGPPTAPLDDTMTPAQPCGQPASAAVSNKAPLLKKENAWASLPGSTAARLSGQSKEQSRYGNYSGPTPSLFLWPRLALRASLPPSGARGGYAPETQQRPTHAQDSDEQ